LTGRRWPGGPIGVNNQEENFKLLIISILKFLQIAFFKGKRFGKAPENN
jgi:hypothetical protein